MDTITVTKNDILEIIYFITAITQKQSSSSMQGALSSKGDQMGGIFDRWINTVPESIIFNKLILPKVDPTNSTKIISDFYIYDPKKVGIAPDVIGLRTTNSIIPFAVFNEKWKPVDDMPQIEVKTFKKPQKMISLRNQNYDNKYLVMTETSLRIDYLLPFFQENIFADEIHQNLTMDDSSFIVSNSKNELQNINKVNISNPNIGKVKLLGITKAKSFMDYSTKCEKNVSIQYIKNIEKVTKRPRGSNLNLPLKHFCTKNKNKLFKFKSNWYDGVTNKIPYYSKGTGDSLRKFFVKTVDFHIKNISAITVIKKSEKILYIEVKKLAAINEYKLEKNFVYKIEFDRLDRSSNKGEEYFMQKDLVKYLPNFKDELEEQLTKIISDYK